MKDIAQTISRRTHACVDWLSKPRAMPRWDAYDMVYLFAIAGTVSTIQ